MGVKAVLAGAALLMAGGAAGFFAAGALTPAADVVASAPASVAVMAPGEAASVDAANGARGGRIIVSFTTDEREHISGEMLAFLQGAQVIGEASLAGDRETIRDVAGSLRRGEGDATGAAIRAKAPEGFTRMSQMLRQDFGAISDMAMTAPMPEVQQALFDAMLKCSSCHGSYGVVESAR